MFSAEKFDKVELFGSVINDDIFIMKMTKKATKRLIRKRIAQRKAKDTTKHTTKPNNSIRSQIMNATVQNMSKQTQLATSSNRTFGIATQQYGNTKPNNSIRGQLMNIAAQNMANGIRPFGYASQQYGNINNERRIEQLRNDAQTKSSELQNNNAILENLQKEVKDVKAENKQMKKMIRDKKLELDKTKQEKGMIEDELIDAEYVERENDRLKEQKRMRERRLAEVNKDNHIIELKQERERLQDEIQKQDLQLIEKQKQLESNIIYNENRKLKDDLDAIIAKHAYYDDILKSDEFKNPHKEHYETLKQLALEKERLRQQKELYDITMESKQIADTLKSQPTKEEYEAVAKEYAAKIDAENQHLMNIKKQQTEVQDEIDMANYQHEQYMKARKNKIEEQHKLDMLSKENTYLNSQLEKDKTNKRYDDQITKAANIRAKGLRQAMVVNMKQELLKQKLENDTLEKVGEIINEEPSEEEKRLSKSIGETRARNEVLKEQQRLKNDLHASSLKLAEEEANTDFHHTDEYLDFLKDNADIKIETQNNLNKAEAMKTFNESVKRRNESIEAFEIQKQLVKIGPDDIQQVNFLIDAADEKFKNMMTKLQIRDSLNGLIFTYGDRWQRFLSKNRRINEMLDNQDTTDAGTLQGIVNDFNRYLKAPPTPPPISFQTPRKHTEEEEEELFE